MPLPIATPRRLRRPVSSLTYSSTLALPTLGYNATGGVATICDVAGLAAHLGVEPRDLRADPSSFEDGCLVAPWSIASLAARRAAERDPDPLLRYVEREEAEARRDAIVGSHYPRRGTSEPWDVSPEICVWVDEEHGKPVRAVLRQWCGEEAVGVKSELQELRKELRRLSTLARSAADAFRRSGAPREGARIDRELAGSLRNSAQLEATNVTPVDLLTDRRFVRPPSGSG